MTTSTTSTVQVGGLRLDRTDALALAHVYLARGMRSSGYPAYDTYDADRAAGPLIDADLLAPVLLNVRQLGIRTYSFLRDAVDTLQEVLDEIPSELDLAVATDDQLQLLGRLFAAVDDNAIPGARGTVLSKVLHRKRPRFIPLYDTRVGHVYQVEGTPPVPVVAGRSWHDFAIAYGSALRDDLQADPDFWDEVAALGRSGPVTPLRALDVVAWSASTNR